AERIDDGLAFEDAVGRALVDPDAMAERLDGHVHDLRDQRALDDPLRRLAQLAQTPILFHQRLVLEQLDACDSQRFRKLRVFLAQTGAVSEAAREPVPSRV